MKIIYFAEALTGKRAQLHCDVVDDGKLVMSYPVGSPAPEAVVKRHEREITLGQKGTR